MTSHTVTSVTTVGGSKADGPDTSPFTGSPPQHKIAAIDHDEGETLDRRSLAVRIVETLRFFWYLGFTSFGGPGVHVVIFRRYFVDQMKWLDATTFTDLFALGNALPGPGSTQLLFSIAVVRNGTLAGLLAFLMWSLPGAAGMAALGAGVRAFPERLPPIVLALLTGLNASAVGLIALAAYQLSQTAITDSVSRLLVLGSASFGICYHAPWMYPVLVFGGGVLTLAVDYRRRTLEALRLLVSSRPRRTVPDQTQPAVHDRSEEIELESVSTNHAHRRTSQSANATSIAPATSNAHALGSNELRNRAVQTDSRYQDRTMQTEVQPNATSARKLRVPGNVLAIALGLSFVVYMVTLIILRARLAAPPRPLDFLLNMAIAGVIIFGGGPVVIPLLRGYTVENGWVESRDFLLGFAILQAFPGPNFNFATYLGVLAVPHNPALGAFLGWFGIFSPGIALKLALLPLYNKWRQFAVAKSILRGLNAAAAGLVFTAVWQLFLVGYIYTPASGTVAGASAAGPLTTDPFWGVIAASAFVATQWFKSPPPVTIVAGALAGLAWFGVVGVSGTERG